MKQVFRLMAASAAVFALLGQGQAFAQTKRYISVDSRCSKPLLLYISHADGYRNWHVHGPFSFGAYEGPTNLRDGGVVLTQSDDHELYIYAESLDGTSTWGGSHHFNYRGLSFGMMKAPMNLVNGDVRINLTCG